MKEQAMQDLERKLIKNGVKNLQDYGYPECDESNILTDRVYSAFFVSMLEDNRGKLGKSVDRAIEKLIEKCRED